MGKPEWGMKRTCQNCGARFYDLRRDPIVCPVCSTVFDPERQPRPRRGARLEAVAPVAAVVPALAAETDDLDEALGLDSEEERDEVGDDDSADEGIAGVDGGDDDEDLMEDTSELGEDDDDIGEVIEHIDDDLADKG